MEKDYMMIGFRYPSRKVQLLNFMVTHQNTKIQRVLIKYLDNYLVENVHVFQDFLTDEEKEMYLKEK